MVDLAKVKRLREKAGLSQAAAAKLASIGSAQAWNNIESGRKANVTVDTLNKIAKALNVRAKNLLK